MEDDQNYSSQKSTSHSMNLKAIITMYIQQAAAKSASQNNLSNGQVA